MNMKCEKGQHFMLMPVFEDELGFYCQIFDKDKKLVGKIRPEEFSPPWVKKLSRTMLAKEKLQNVGKMGTSWKYWDVTFTYEIDAEEKNHKFWFLCQTRNGHIQICNIASGGVQEVGFNEESIVKVTIKQEKEHEGSIPNNASILWFNESTQKWELEVRTSPIYGD